MNKKKWVCIVIVYSMIYTVITLLSSILYPWNDIFKDLSSSWRELDGVIILLIGIAAFGLCTNLPVKHLLLGYAATYIPSLLLAFVSAWLGGLWEPLAKTAYRDIWMNLTSLFVLLCIINTAFYVYKKKGESKRNGKKP